MSICPFCKSAVSDAAAPCPKCGRRANDHPSVQGMQGRTIDSSLGDDDWNDDGCRTVGMFLNGSPLRSPGPRGEQVRDTSFMIWLNAGGEDVQLTLPANKWVHHGEVVLSTNADVALGTPVVAGGSLELQAHSVLVLRQTY